MMKKLKTLLLSLGIVFSFGLSSIIAAPLLVSAPAYAVNEQTEFNNNLCSGSNFNVSGTPTAADPAGCAKSDSTLSTKIKKVLNILSAFIGILAVIMLIYAGFRYVSSAGGEAGVKAAKNAIVYAIIGLVVVALAQIIVHFVISSATGA